MSWQVHIRVENGKHQCYRTPDGILREDVGPPFDKPKQAIAYANKLEAQRAS